MHPLVLAPASGVRKITAMRIDAHPEVAAPSHQAFGCMVIGLIWV
jgi:hypothetical protein